MMLEANPKAQVCSASDSHCQWSVCGSTYGIVNLAYLSSF